MQLSSFVRRVFAVVALVSMISLSAFADTIRLKDGSIIKGRIVSFSAGRFNVEIGEGSRKRQMSFSADEIASIVFDARQMPVEAKQPVQTPAKKDEIINVSTKTTADVPVPLPKVVTTDNTTPVTSPPRTTVSTGNSSITQPIQLSVKVLADNTNNGWTNTGWVVRKGQRIHITGDGQVSLGKGKVSTPEGLPDLPDEQKLLKSVATGALIAVIGDDNNDFMYIGAEREFTATRDGTLFLGINEGNLDDNSGSFDVKIQISPGGSE